jgi:hypothetical protein
MITVFFRTDTVEASQTFDADYYSGSKSLTLYKGDEAVATFNEGTWIYVFLNEYSLIEEDNDNTY